MPKVTAAPASSSSSDEVKEVVAEKAQASPASPKLSTRNRNRFNIRPSTTTVNPELNAETQSTTSRLLNRPRPNFNVRGRGRPGAASTTEAPASVESVEKSETEDESKEEAAPVEKPAVAARPTSRLNLNRPTNRLLPGQKQRASPLARSKPADEEGHKEKSSHDGDSETETTTQSGLNKLKNRPRIQISAEPKKKATTNNNVLINRKVNPLLSKRKFGLVSSTGELNDDSEVVNCVNIPIYADAPADVEEKHEDDSDNNSKEGAKEEGSEEHKEEESTEVVEVSSEQPRGLSKITFYGSESTHSLTKSNLIPDLLNRRNILKRRPGTIL